MSFEQSNVLIGKESKWFLKHSFFCILPKVHLKYNKSMTVQKNLNEVYAHYHGRIQRIKAADRYGSK